MENEGWLPIELNHPVENESSKSHSTSSYRIRNPQNSPIEIEDELPKKIQWFSKFGFGIGTVVAIVVVSTLIKFKPPSQETTEAVAPKPQSTPTELHPRESWKYELEPEVKEGKFFFTLENHNSWVRFLKFSPSGETLISGSYDGTLREWNLNNRSSSLFVIPNKSPILAVDFIHRSKALAVSSNDRSVRIWKLDRKPLSDLTNKKPNFDTSHPIETAISVAMSSDARSLARSYSSGKIEL